MPTRPNKTRSKRNQQLKLRLNQDKTILFILLSTGLIIAIIHVFGARKEHFYAHKSACSLYSLNDAQKLLGKKTVNDTHDPISNKQLKIGSIIENHTYCHYTLSGVESNESYVQYAKGVTKLLAINVYDVPNKESKDRLHAAFLKSNSESGIKSISNLGDDALYNPHTGEVIVASQNYGVEVAYFERPNLATEQSFNQSMATQVARQIIANIKN